MAEPPWWQTAVIYQIYPRSFLDTNGDGIGDLQGITNKLGYLARDLGVDAIWISPFYPSPMADFGYDVADYCDVDPRFGTMTDFDQLVATAHDEGLRVIIDWVPNHSSDEHPWFAESRSSRENAKRDWYVWAEPDAKGDPPNNWISVFGGSAWEFDETSAQFYLHSFLREQPDLNWRNPEVEAAMHNTLRFWLDRSVDGFRLDVAHFIMKDPGLRSNPPADGRPSRQNLGPYNQQNHIHDKGHPDVHDAFRRIRSLVDEYEGDRFTVGEIHVFEWERWARYYGDGDELHMPYNFSLLYAPWDAAAFQTLIDEMEAVLPAKAWPNLVLGNHDEVRMATRYGPEQTRVAAMALLTLRGTATMYFGDEVGMTEASTPAELHQDPWVRPDGTTRDGCRTPMQWDESPNAGFTGADTAPWLPVGADKATANVAVQITDPTSLLSLYRSLLALRRRSPALQSGDYRPVTAPNSVFAYSRRHHNEELIVALNFGEDPQVVGVPSGSSLQLATAPSSTGLEADGLHLGGNSGAVISVP
jgi:glycosidase